MRAATPRRRWLDSPRWQWPTRMRGLPTTWQPVSVQAELGGSGRVSSWPTSLRSCCATSRIRCAA